MRRTAFLAMPLGLLLAMPAAAQHWNDSGPGRDLLSSTVGEFDSFRQRAPAAREEGQRLPRRRRKVALYTEDERRFAGLASVA